MSDNVRRDNRRALPKYLLTILLFGLLGGVLGFFTGVAGAAGVAETVRQALDRVLAVCAPWGIVGSAVVLLGAGWYLYAAAKRRFAAWDGEDEDAMDAAEQQLSWALLLTGLVIILDFFFFAASIIYDRFLPDLILFLASVAVLVVLVRQIMLANYEGAFFCILTLLLLYVPSWIQVKLRIELPPPLEITIFCFIFAAEILGEVNAFYVVIPGWDTMLHTINGFLAAAVGFSMVMLLNDDDRITFHLSPAFLALVAFCFSMTIGVLWEFFEFGMDFFLGTDMQKDTVIHAIHSVSLDPTLSNKVVTIPDIQDVVINGESLGLGGYLDIGIIDTMKDLFVNFIGAVVFSLSGFFFARSKGRRKSAAQGFVPSKKTAEQDYLQQALEEADQKDADAPTPDGPPAPGEPEGA